MRHVYRYRSKTEQYHHRKAKCMPTNTPATRGERPTELVPWADCPKPIPRYLTELPWATDNTAIIDDITERILAAETMEEVLELDEATEFVQLVGRRITVKGFVMRPSALKDGIGAYALVGYTDLDSGQEGITSTSAAGCLAQLARAFQLDQVPFDCKVVEVQSRTVGHDNPLYFTHIRPTQPAGEEPF